MDHSDEEYLGRVAYGGYRLTSGGVSLIDGQDLPEWSDLRDEIQSAWCAAAGAVQREISARDVPAEGVTELKFEDEEG